jgi:hypothetical protein
MTERNHGELPNDLVLIDEPAMANKLSEDPVAEFTRVYGDCRPTGRKLDSRVHSYVRWLLFCLGESDNRYNIISTSQD